jgi:putative transposase
MRVVSREKAVVLEPEQRVQLEAFARSRALPHALVLRAQIVLSAAEGKQNRQIAEATKMSRQTVAKWRGRFVSRGLEGLYDEYRSGRPRSIDDERIAELVNSTLKSKPQGATQWSCRGMAETTGLSKSTVQRVWSAFGLQPHRQESFKLSTDAFFIEKLRGYRGIVPESP